MITDIENCENYAPEFSSTEKKKKEEANNRNTVYWSYVNTITVELVFYKADAIFQQYHFFMIFSPFYVQRPPEAENKMYTHESVVL